MLQRRVIVCLDVRDGRTTKGVRFQDNIDVGDPVEMARHYYDEGADELVFYDITASAEERKIMIDVVRRVAEVFFVPFSVGGGIAGLDDMREAIQAGAEKVSVNSQAVRNPGIIEEGASHFGRQFMVLGLDAARDEDMPSGYRVFVDGMRTATDLDALAWAKEAEALGAGEIVLNAIDTDGVGEGYELEATKLISESVGIPVVASGGAGTPAHLLEVFEEAHADAALIASMVHFGTYTIRSIKEHLARAGVPVRLDC